MATVRFHGIGWLLGLLIATSLQAHALGTAFTYQGQLQHSGTVENDTCDFQFTLFDAASGGTQVGSTQTLTPVTGADGLFTVPLDFGGTAFNGADRFLQIAVRCPVGSGSYTTLTPRQPLSAAPYALYSPVAGVANDLTCTGCLSSTDLANGAITAAKIGDGQVSTAKLSAGGSTNGQVLTSNGAGVVWQSPSAATNTWNLTGNAGTTASNFLGTTDNKALELRVNGARALRIEPAAGSPNVIGGFSGNAATSASVAGATIGGGGGNSLVNVVADFATVGGGLGNRASGANATVGGGYANEASGATASVGGGFSCVASGLGATIAGGDRNTVSGQDAAIGGGLGNSAQAAYATIGGGGRTDPTNASTGNHVSDDYGTVGGGGGNQTGNNNGDTRDAAFATVGGGVGNSAANYWAAVGGGGANTARGLGATVGGGLGNDAQGAFATIAGGGRSNVSDVDTGHHVTDDYGTVGGGGHNFVGNGNADTTDAVYATVGGGLNNLASGKNATVSGGANNDATHEDSTVSGGSANTANRPRATIGGGSNNEADGDSNTVAGGLNNRAIGDFAATIGGGQSNGAAANHATVAGGILNIAGSMASDENATVAGGFGNQATAPFATIGGGGRTNANDETTGNRVTGPYGTVAGGGNNLASGTFATVAGGTRNLASGAFSFAAGRDAHATHAGSVVFSDGTRAGLSAHANDFNVTSTGGVEFYYSTNGSEHCDLVPGQPNWNCTSDRNAKENFVSIDQRALLQRLGAMAITQWNMKGAEPGNRHIGPMAQDFHAAFELGTDDTTINTSDAQGVALAAIQGLYAMIREKDAEIAELEARLAVVEQNVIAQTTRVSSEDRR